MTLKQEDNIDNGDKVDKKLSDTYLLLSQNFTYQTTDLIKGKVFKILLKRVLKDYKETPFLVDKMGNILFLNLSRTGKVCFLFSQDGRIFNILKLPDDIDFRLGEYIRSIDKLKGSKIDCSSFIHFLYGAPIREKTGDKQIVLDMNSWDYKKVTLEELKPGDVLFIGEITKTNLKNGKYHWVLYLGQGLFISKYYNMSGFVITDIQALFEMGGTDIFNLMNPKFIPNFENKLEDYIL